MLVHRWHPRLLVLPLAVQEPATTWAAAASHKNVHGFTLYGKGPGPFPASCWSCRNRWQDYIFNLGGVSLCPQSLLLARQAVGSCDCLAVLFCILVGFGMQHAVGVSEDRASPAVTYR